LKVLIIEDSPEVVEAISLCLQLRWPEVVISSATEGNKGIETLESEPFDLIILDLNLPDLDGFQVLKKIPSLSNIPVIIITVRGDEDDRVRGLEMGADDYIVKPFKPRDVIARINAVLRRARTSEVTTTQPSITRGNLVLDLATDNVKLGEETMKLTSTETKVLYILMKNAERTINSNTILQEVWGKERMNSDLLRTNIRRIRDKLKDKPPRIIINQRGGGYRFISPM
jgi:two-component system KDP operon response regulator KdpE